MTLIDARGRIGGRFNLLDVLVALVVIGLVPVGIATYLLFRTPPARITSVTPVPITREERRIAAGSYIATKLKVRGAGLRPVLRAFVDTTPALGFVFETPYSADVIVGAAPPGVHDLVLYDGVQEVARARKSVTIAALPASGVRVLGLLVDMDRATAESLRETSSYPGGEQALTTIVRLGPIEPARRRLAVSVDGGFVDLPMANLWERRVVADIRCDIDSAEDDCSVGGVSLMHSVAPSTGDPVATVYTRAFSLAWPTPLRMTAADILPNRPPQPLTVKVKLTGPADLLARIAVNDRDDFWDDRAAIVTAVAPARDGFVVFRLGGDPSRDGWRYRGHLLRPGAPFVFRTERYVVEGTTVDVIGAPSGNGTR